MKYIAANLVSLSCIAGAIYLMIQNKDGWGWLLLIALLTYTTLGTTKEEKDKDEEED